MNAQTAFISISAELKLKTIRSLNAKDGRHDKSAVLRVHGSDRASRRSLHCSSQLLGVVMAQFSIHGIKAIHATTLGMSGGLKLQFTDEYHWHGDSEVLIFGDDSVLSERLAEAINRLFSERCAEIEAQACEPASEEMETV